MGHSLFLISPLISHESIPWGLVISNNKDSLPLCSFQSPTSSFPFCSFMINLVWRSLEADKQDEHLWVQGVTCAQSRMSEPRHGKEHIHIGWGAEDGPTEVSEPTESEEEVHVGRGYSGLWWNMIVTAGVKSYGPVMILPPEDLRDASLMLEELNNFGLVDRRKY